MSLKKIFASSYDRLLIRSSHGHTWSKLWIYWFLVSLLLSRVTLLFLLLSMGSSTITTNIRMRFVYAISFAKHANLFPPPAKEDFDVVWALQSENNIAFQIGFCLKMAIATFFFRSIMIPTMVFVFMRITIYLYHIWECLIPTRCFKSATLRYN